LKILEWFGYVTKKEMDKANKELLNSISHIQLEKKGYLKEIEKLQLEKKGYLKEIEKLKSDVSKYEYKLTDLRTQIKNHLESTSKLSEKVSELERENYLLRSNKLGDIRNDKIKAHILHFLYNKYKWSGHSPIEEVVNRCRSDKITRDKSEVRRNLQELINRGFLIRTKSRKKVDLNSNMKKEILAFIQKHLNIKINKE